MSKLSVFKAFKPGEEIARLDRVSREGAFQALSRAHSVFDKRTSWLPGHERIQILRKAAVSVRERKNELALQIAQEGGKPLRDSLVEMNRAVEGIEIAIREMGCLTGEEVKMGISPASSNRMAYTKREPRGVVLAISAFNHPFNLIVHQIIPAIAVGAPVLVKPASSTPLSCKSLVEILHDSGLPRDWCQFLPCEASVAQELVSDPRVSFLSFIGSSEVGWKLRGLLSPGATCALEHGGVAPAIIDRSADLDDAIPLLIKGGFYHAGQVCVSVQRVYVHQEIHEEFLEKFVKGVKELKVGDPEDPETEVGPLISHEEIARVDHMVQNAIQEGAILLCGGEQISEVCYAPTILLNPRSDSEVSTKEIFGPVVCVYDFKKLDEAIGLANSLPYCFQSSLFTRDLDSALQGSSELEAHAVMINDHTAFRVDWMPFGGSKESGMGVGGIGPSMEEMTYEKLTVFRSTKLPG